MAVMLSERKTSQDLLQRCKIASRKVNTGVPQGSKLSPSLFSFYIDDMLRSTEPVKWVCYADDLTVWATGVKIPDLEDSVNSYLEEITAYLKGNSLLISAPKSTVTLFSPGPHQPKTHLRIEDSQLPLNTQSYYLYSIWLDVWNQEMSSTPSDYITRVTPKRQMKETLFTRHRNTPGNSH